MSRLNRVLNHILRGSSDANIYQEAVANAEMVIEEWIETAKEEGRTIPTPKGRLIYA